MIKRAFIFLIGLFAYSIRMCVVSLGVGVLAFTLAGELAPSWRYWSIFGLIGLAYVFVACIEMVAEHLTPSKAKGQ